MQKVINWPCNFQWGIVWRNTMLLSNYCFVWKQWVGVRLYSHHPFPSQKRKKKENKSEWSVPKSGTFSENKIIKQYSTVRDYMDVNQEGNTHSYIEEGHTIQWPNEKKDRRTNNDLTNIHIILKIE
jgi:hypothetical protein